MQRNKKTKHPPVAEGVRRAVNLALRNFLSSDTKEYEFPSSLVAGERAYVHTMAKSLKLRSKSRGTGLNRYITVYKREGSTIVQSDPCFSFTPVSRQSINGLMHKYPLNAKEKQDVTPLTERDRTFAPDTAQKDNARSLGRLSAGVPIVPVTAVNQDALPHRQSLPIWPLRESIMETIQDSQVVIISGETGSGKTTQVPQLIMEYHTATKRPCRIICSQPRRISAVTISERVAYERNVKLGSEVGYQIRHESRINTRTVLTYCTNGILLRTLMSGDSSLATITHLVVDEVHERDRLSDFVLIAIRDALSKYRSLKLILMSATIETLTFSKYFSNCPVITVPGRLYDVQSYFLEDILKRTNFMTKDMAKMKREWEKKHQHKVELDKWVASMNHLQINEQQQQQMQQISQPDEHWTSQLMTQVPPPPQHGGSQHSKEWMVKEMDSCIEKAWINSSEQAFKQMLVLIQTENVSVDYQHSVTGLTPLMVGACHGYEEIVEFLLNLGASLNIQASNNHTALDWAQQQNHSNIVDLLKTYINYYPGMEVSETGSEKLTSDPQLSEEDKQMLQIYQNCFAEESINVELILAVVNEIQASNRKGSILVFLPGYDDIVNVRDRLKAREAKPKELKIFLMTLYSKMNTIDQKRVFAPAPPGTRKVILSTNIAETSITIDDVVFVVDTGLFKERSYDAMSGVSVLKAMKCSQACAHQRRGRAGRTQPGVCYHLFSSLDYQAMMKYRTPEILRTPLQELCLQTKLLAQQNTPIADFLAKAIDPPSFIVTRNAVQFLKTIDALDSWEDLTQLGHHLLDLPLLPHLGKTVIYSIILKCVDPVLTIVAGLAYRDPFMIPDQPQLKRAVMEERKNFAGGAFSDHMALLRVFLKWVAAKEKGASRAFCEQHCLCEASLEMMMAHRAQILQELRYIGFVKNRGPGDMKDLNVNSENWAVVKAALCGGIYPNLVRVDRETNTLRTQREFRVLLHPSSTLREAGKQSFRRSYNDAITSCPTDWLLYEELSRVGNLCHVRTCTVVTDITVAVFAGPARVPADCISDPETMEPGSDSDEEEIPEGRNAMLKLDDWVMFRLDPETARLALMLRMKWHALLMKRLRAPGKPWTQVDEAVIESIVQVLKSEEAVAGLQQPIGIGARPRQPNSEAGYPQRRPLMETSDEMNVFLSTIESSGNRYMTNQQRRHHDAAKAMQDHAEKTDSIMSYGSGTPSPTPSSHSGSVPEPSQQQHKGAVSSNVVFGGNARYFVIKAGPLKSIEASYALGAWPFTVNTEKKVVRAYKEGKTVILVFGLQGSGHFQGFARLKGDKPEQAEPIPDLTGQNLNAPLPIEWIKRANIPYPATRHLVNPYNENNKVQTSRDGQEIEPGVGEALCHLWDKSPQWVPKNMPAPPHIYHQGGGGFGRPIRGPPPQQYHYSQSNSYAHSNSHMAGGARKNNMM